MMLPRIRSKRCDRCKEPVASRYRTLIDRYLCSPCWEATQQDLAVLFDPLGTTPVVEGLREELRAAPADSARRPIARNGFVSDGESHE